MAKASAIELIVDNETRRFWQGIAEIKAVEVEVEAMKANNAQAIAAGRAPVHIGYDFLKPALKIREIIEQKIKREPERVAEQFIDDDLK